MKLLLLVGRVETELPAFLVVIEEACVFDTDSSMQLKRHLLERGQHAGNAHLVGLLGRAAFEVKVKPPVCMQHNSCQASHLAALGFPQQAFQQSDGFRRNWAWQWFKDSDPHGQG
jgi:hypothetical protein